MIVTTRCHQCSLHSSLYRAEVFDVSIYIIRDTRGEQEIDEIECQFYVQARVTLRRSDRFKVIVSNGATPSNTATRNVIQVY